MIPHRKHFQPHVDNRSMNVNAVKIVNLPSHINRREVVALFNALIGDVRNTTEFRDAVGTHMEILFSTQDAAKKALCMSGYTIGGCSLVVTAVENVEDYGHKRQDPRRNLYVLGIPFDITKQEFTAIFSRYGTVSHCVVLATVDNASRRRGFVVMSNHEEAKRAMMALTRTQIKGHTIDISWSIVQRSQGFLDGGDRTNLFDPQVDGSEEPQAESPSPTDIQTTQFNNSFTLALTPTTTLLVTNLPFILFSQKSDLEPLVCPFGEVKKLETISLPSPQDTTSVLVDYTDVSSAQDAKEYLQGQCYANYRINAEYACLAVPVLPQIPVTPDFSTNGHDRGFYGHEQNIPLQRSSSAFSGPGPMHCSQNAFRGHNTFAKPPLQDISNSFYVSQSATPTFTAFSNKTPIPRTSSASSKWSVDSSRCTSRNQDQNLPPPRFFGHAKQPVHSG